MTSATETTRSFEDMGLPAPLLKTLAELGYESPSPIQEASIPALMTGVDLLGQAQTGTGKTAAFALPLLATLDGSKKTPQILVLAPTRELAIQVAEAFQRYSRYMRFNVLPIYGGQAYSNQLQQLKRGAQIIVGTPGRVMDHIRRKSLVLDDLKTLVLDEADEMLRMGFIDDVEWILEHIPEKRQIALFSATMPKEIKKVANTYLVDPTHVKIENKTATASTIRQRFTLINQSQKLDATTRILEAEDYDGVIIFVRTKIATVELADKLAARGFRSDALNGDIAQNHREKIVDKLKSGKLDILIATDVVARGLDVERVSHVINYDIPLDTESYVHRIGRTGRAGRTGDAILLVTPRERRLLNAIERVTNSPMESMEIPSSDLINARRSANFKQNIIDTIANRDLAQYSELINEIIQDNDHSPETIAAALACISQGDKPLFEKERSFKVNLDGRDRKGRNKDRNRDRGDRKGSQTRRQRHETDKDMVTYRIEVGRNDGVKPGNIVGAIANEASINSRHIGHIRINDDHSTVDLPKGMPKDTMHQLNKAYVCGKKLQLSLQK